VGASTRRIWSAAGKLGILAVVAVAFTSGLILTVYLSLRSPTIQVPDVVNQQYMEGETTLEKSGLNMRERARRYKPDVPPGVILDQSPRAGEVVKAGQTIAVVVSRARKEGEQPPSEEVAEERKKEEAGEARKENLNANAARNENRERRNRNRNSNANANANGNRNANAANRNAGNTNSRPANTNRNAGANTNAANGNTRPRVTTNRNTSPGGARNANTARPAGNSNRRPNL
jgi:beta-lactam-binding protein with PASTA domain